MTLTSIVEFRWIRVHPPNLPNIAQAFFHHSDGLKVSSVVESITSEEEQLDKVACDIPASHIQPAREVGEGKPLIYWADMGHTVPTVYHNPCQQTYTNRHQFTTHRYGRPNRMYTLNRNCPIMTCYQQYKRDLCKDIQYLYTILGKSQ